MKKKSVRMQPLRRVAESREQRAATELGKAQQQLDAQLERLKELENYQHEYFTQFQQAGQSGVAIDKLQSFRSFLDKLESAVEQQKQVVKSAGDLVDKRKRQWFSCRDKVKVYDKVIGRFVDQEHYQQESRDQKETDERAQRSK